MSDIPLTLISNLNPAASPDGLEIPGERLGANFKIDLGLAIDNKLSPLSAQISTNTGNITTNASAISGLQSSVSSLQSDVAALDPVVASNTSRIDAAETTISSNTGRITAVEGVASGNSSAITALQSSVTTLQSDVSALDANVVKKDVGGDFAAAIGVVNSGVPGDLGAYSRLVNNTSETRTYNINGEFIIANNCKYDGVGQWSRIDESEGCSRIRLAQISSFVIVDFAGPGAGSISFVEILNLGQTELTKLPAIKSTTAIGSTIALNINDNGGSVIGGLRYNNIDDNFELYDGVNSFIKYSNTNNKVEALVAGVVELLVEAGQVTVENDLFVDGVLNVGSASISDWVSVANFARLGHEDFNLATGYGLLQAPDGGVFIEGATDLKLRAGTGFLIMDDLPNGLPSGKTRAGTLDITNDGILYIA